MAYLYLLITFTAWGSLYVVSKFVLGKVPTFTTSFIRSAIAAIVLNIALKQRKVAKISPEDYKYIFIIGFFGYFISMGTQFIGTKLTNASLASLINSMNPITITLLASLILKEKISPRNVISILVLLIGVRILIGDINDNVYIGGILFSLLSVFIWSLVSVLIRKVTRKYNPIQITAYGITMGAVFNLPVSMYEIYTTPDIEFDAGVIIATIYMGLVCTALAHLLWNKSLSMLDAGVCSLFYPIQPLVATLLGIIFLNEAINKNFIIGGLLIVGAVVFNIIGNVKRANSASR
ncbi:MAG: EamA family transporter [Tissierellia bacterium]|nr:EamA family transporter [Tissierellia bacterium]